MVELMDAAAHRGNIRYLWFKEAAISAINGVLWGGVMGLVAFALRQCRAGPGHDRGYRDHPGGPRRHASPGARSGVRLASVLLTFTTDSTGFFVFLGLATVFLLGLTAAHRRGRVMQQPQPRAPAR